MGARLQRDLDFSGRYYIAVDFASKDEAERNNERPETARWAGNLAKLGTAEYLNVAEVYRTPS